MTLPLVIFGALGIAVLRVGVGVYVCGGVAATTEFVLRRWASQTGSPVWVMETARVAAMLGARTGYTCDATAFKPRPGRAACSLHAGRKGQTMNEADQRRASSSERSTSSDGPHSTVVRQRPLWRRTPDRSQ
jgi:hypothetical protein